MNSKKKSNTNSQNIDLADLQMSKGSFHTNAIGTPQTHIKPLEESSKQSEFDHNVLLKRTPIIDYSFQKLGQAGNVTGDFNV